MLSFHPYHADFLLFLFLYDIKMCILNIFSAIKEMAIKKLKDFMFENYYSQKGFARENSYYSMKHPKNI